MPTRNVVITDRHAAFIEECVKSGEYQNASEVLREGLRLVEERRARHAAKLEALRAAVQVGIDSIERGNGTRFDSPEAFGAYLDSVADEAIAQTEAELAAEAKTTRISTPWWNVELTPDAKQDFADIIRWTRKEFGQRQVQIYRATLKGALQTLHNGPNTLGVKKRDDINLGIHSLHVARNGRKGRHFMVFSIGQNQTINILRLLHDSMDMNAHLAE